MHYEHLKNEIKQQESFFDADKVYFNKIVNSLEDSKTSVEFLTAIKQ